MALLRLKAVYNQAKNISFLFYRSSKFLKQVPFSLVNFKCLTILFKPWKVLFKWNLYNWEFLSSK